MTGIDTRLRSRRLMAKFGSDIAGVPIVLAILLVGTALLVGVVAVLESGEVTVSGWEAASQVARWYAGAMGVYLTAVYLPLYVAHGYTRREYTSRTPIFLVGFAAVFALSMTVGFALEGLAYGRLGWEQGLANAHLYATPNEYGMVLLEFALIGAIWTGAGTVLGGAFYRNPALGLALIPVGLLMVAIVEVTAGPGYAGPFNLADNLPFLGSDLAASSASLAAVVCLVTVLAAFALMWAIVKDMPIRTQSN